MEQNNTQDLIEKSEIQSSAIAAMERFSATRLRIETINFDLDYKRSKTGAIELASEKAIIRTMGQVVKVKIGEDQEYKTYEEAAEATRLHWSAYFKARRDNMTDQERRTTAKRQKRYRERRAAKAAEFEQQGN